MSGTLIINDSNSVLADQINSTLDTSTDISFLVGYFYFSGFAELYKKIGDRKMRILVGLDIDVDIYNVVRECEKTYSPVKSYMSQSRIRDDYYKHLVELFKTDIFDSKENEAAFRLFCKKIEDGTLEIRKTLEPNHSKLYLFQAENQSDPTMPGHMILGSSNLSRSGLRSQNELNVIFHDEDYNKGKDLFDKLWFTATPIADMQLFQEFKNKVLQNIWLDKLPSPYVVYLRVLEEYFSSNMPDGYIKTPSQLAGYTDLEYQTDAIKSAIAKLKRHNGVIIADVVGLGKSVIGSSIAANLNIPVVVICPPHLQQQWEDYCSQFGIGNISHVYSSGKIEDAVKRHGNSEQELLIIVDEAHRYRNEKTDDYARLKILCNGNKVVLLTATPYNNRPKDLANLIYLFQKPGKSTLRNVENLGSEFDDLIAKYKNAYNATKKDTSPEAMKAFVETSKNIAKRIQNLIAPVTIRRSRKDLQEIKKYAKDLKERGMEFSYVADPQSLEYDISPVRDIYLETLNAIYPRNIEEIDEDVQKLDETTYKAARYKALLYVKPEFADKVIRQLQEEGYEDIDFVMNQSQRQLAKFMRRLLVQRFESSIAAFQASLDLLISNSENIIKFIEHRNTIPVYKRGNLPDIEKLRDIAEDTLLGVEEALEAQVAQLKSKGLFEIKIEYIDPKFIEDVKSDIAILKDIRDKWFGKDKKIKADPKIESFIIKIKEQLAREPENKDEPERKIVVFSGYADTAKYLYDKLHEEGLPVFYYSSLTASKANRMTIIENFDAGKPANEQRNDFKILIATDAIAEGYSLHRAGTIINYDIPYNPTVVIQRVGRINRINKKVFNTLYIYNFFPTDIGEAEVGVKKISTIKMRMINTIMGSDTKTLTNDEQLERFIANSYKNAQDEADQLSWETQYINDWLSAKNTPEYKEALAISPRTRIHKTDKSVDNRVIVFGKQGEECIFKQIFKSTKTPELMNAEDALPLFKSDKKDVALNVTDNFDELYQIIKANLFTSLHVKNSPQQGAALAKINVWKNDPNFASWSEYLELLTKAIEIDDIQNYKPIKKAKDPAELSELIPVGYLQKTADIIAKIEAEPTDIILTEELS